MVAFFKTIIQKIFLQLDVFILEEKKSSIFHTKNHCWAQKVPIFDGFLRQKQALIVTFDADLPPRLVLEKNVKTTLGGWDFAASMCA